MTRYLDRVIAGEAATVDEWNDHLVTFHRTYDGATPGLLARLRTPDGQTSYQLLASRIRALAPGVRDILELGCGDGALLGLLASLYSGVALHGVDLSEGEIALARTRVPRASFERGDASRIDMGHMAYDVVASHLSFMLMPSSGMILAHAHKALREGGLLAFVIEDPLAGDTIVNALREALTFVSRRLPNFSPTIPGRAALERDEVLHGLLAEADFRSISIERFVVQAVLSPEERWNFVERTYMVGLLDPQLRRDLREALRNGPAEATLALRFVTARR